MTPTPKYALPCWADDRSFYVQVPNPKGEPVTIAYPLHSMSLAIPLLRRHFESTPRPVAIPSKPEHPFGDTAKALMRKMGMMG